VTEVFPSVILDQFIPSGSRSGRCSGVCVTVWQAYEQSRSLLALKS